MASNSDRVISGPPSKLTCHALRIKPGQEIRRCLLNYVKAKNLRAPFVLTCVGSVTQVSLRMADSSKVSVACHPVHFMSGNPGRPVAAIGLCKELLRLYCFQNKSLRQDPCLVYIQEEIAQISNKEG